MRSLARLLHRRPSLLLVAALAACAGARADPRARPDAGAATAPSQPAPAIADLDGVWTEPLDPFRVVQLVAAGDEILIAGRIGARPEIRVGRLQGGTLRLAPFRPIPLPPASTHGWDDLGGVDPWLAVDEARSPRQLAIDRVEYQGGSWGIAVFPDIASPAHEELASPTGESDIGFGAPLLLRGDDLFTNDAEVLAHYHRRGGAWTRSPLAVASSWWSLAATRDGATVVASTLDSSRRLRTGEGRPEDDPASIVVLGRAGDGSYQRTRDRALPSHVSGLAFAGRRLVVGLQRPAADGSAIWIFDPPYADPAARIAIPFEHFGDSGPIAVATLDAQGRFALAGQVTALWAIDLAAARVACRLRLPPRPDGRDPRPLVAVWGTQAVVAEANRVGLFDLARCGRGGLSPSRQKQ